MISSRNWYLVLALLFITKLATAQISLTFPADRAVFQRSNQNNATIYIAGYFTQDLTSIEARLTPIVSGEGAAVPNGGGWTTIDAHPVHHNFYGSLVATGGWYKLEVRGTDGLSYYTSSVEHVGIGEVFLVAGQSNATGGDNNPNGPGAKYDQVNTIDFQNYNPTNQYIAPYSSIELPCPEYVHLNAATKTAPFGNYAWCWGAFGDQMYEKYKVPIMIFNAGWSSTSVGDWVTTIDPNNIAIGAFNQTFPQGLPFGHMRVALNNYINQLGVRAILWHQGESDNLIGTTKVDYKTRLASLISASRSLSNKTNLAWLVARASRFTINDVSTVSAEVVTAQNEIIAEDATYPHVYAGPATDDYYDINYRHDLIHFRGDGVTTYPDGHVYSGLVHLAQFWTDRVTPEFISNSIPYTAQAPPRIDHTNTGASTIQLSTVSKPEYFTYQWLSSANCNTPQSTDSKWSTGTGIYGLKILDSNGNAVLAPRIQITAGALPVDLMYFSVALKNGVPTFYWATASESNSDRFEVERSQNAIHFEPVISRKANGNSNSTTSYVAQEEALKPGQYYYRLKQIDLDESYTYSHTVPFKIESSETISIYPNPVMHRLTIEGQKALGEIVIYDVQGRKILDQISPKNSHQIDTSSYPSGLYIIHVNGNVFKLLK
jgi:hypothetical protein